MAKIDWRLMVISWQCIADARWMAAKIVDAKTFPEARARSLGRAILSTRLAAGPRAIRGSTILAAHQLADRTRSVGDPCFSLLRSGLRRASARRMHTHELSTILALGVLLLGTGACSGESAGVNSGSSGASGTSTSTTSGGGGGDSACPNVGFKACPNDAPVTEQGVKLCETCKPSWQALRACQGSEVACGPDGKKAGNLKEGCAQAFSDYMRCAFSTAGK
jgi:hypothetical protein